MTASDLVARRTWALGVVVVLLALLAAPRSAPAADAAPDGRVLVASFTGEVNPVSEGYLDEAIGRAERDGFSAIVIELDTPGGLVSSMRAMVQRILRASVPVVVYVAPDGARAASAGAYLVLASDVAVMAPQTTIGAATPISLGGGDIEGDAGRKVLNDAAASARALAEEHGRSGDWAERAVREGASLTAREALAEGVVELVSPDLDALLADLDGVRTRPDGVALATAGVAVERMEMSTWKRILELLIDPNIVVLLLAVGVIGLLVEGFNPGGIVPGTVGLVSIVLGLYGLQVMPVRWAGLLLMAVALGLLVAEAFITSYGLLSVAGAVAFAAGALVLYDPAGPGYGVSPWLAVPLAAGLAGIAALTVAKAIQASRATPTTGSLHDLVGQIAVARGALDPGGLVFVHGELWRAESTGGPVADAAEVRVEALRDDLLLEVAPAPERASENPPHDEEQQWTSH